MSKKRRDIPTYSPIIETHFHLDMLKNLTHDEVLGFSKTHNIEKLITIATSPDNLDQVFELAKLHPNVFCTQGVHPHEGSEWTDEVDAHIRKNLSTKNPKIVAVGEIGLDYYYNKSPREPQINAFEKQLQIAVDFDLPVVIHTRDADEDTIAVMKNFSSKLKRKGVVHSFTSGLALAQFALDEGFCLGFNGIITFKNAENVRDALRLAPINQILLETDAPFLTPEPYRGVENAPHYLPFVAEKIAEVKGVTLDELLPQIYKNSVDLFRF